MGNVTIFAPNGQIGEIPEEQLAAAVRAGAKPGVHIVAPNGKPGVVPADRYVDAAKAGAKIQPFEEQEIKHPGFWASLGDDLVGMAKGAVQTAQNASMAAGGNPIPLASQLEGQRETMVENAQHRNDEGRSLPYRVVAPLGELAGANVRGMEDAADQGDVSGVAGHAMAVPAAIALTKGAARMGGEIATAAPTLEDLGKVTPKQVAQGTGATAGGISGHGTLSAPGAYYGGKFGGKVAEGVLGKETANTPISDLINDWRVSTGTKPGAYNPGAPLPEAPSTELQQSSALAQPGAPPPEPPAAALGKLPVAQVEAPVPSASPLSKAQLSKQLEVELNKATGGKPLQPGVPLKNQVPAGAPETSEVPKGFTPVDSSALKAYRYDPDAHELTAITKGGSTYTHGEVTPAQAEDFSNGKFMGQGESDPPSIGKAWKDIRDSSPLVSKTNAAGEVTAERPQYYRTVGPESAAPSGTSEGDVVTRGQQLKGASNTSSIGDDLMELLNKSLENAKGAKGATAETPKATNPASGSVPAKSTDGRTGPSAALYGPREPEFPIASGAHTEVSVPGSDNTYPAQYEVRELSDLHPYDQAA